MGVPTVFDRDGKCPWCDRGTKVGDAIVGWDKVARRNGGTVNVPKHDCHNPRTGLPDAGNRDPEFRPASSLPAAAGVSGTGSPAPTTFTPRRTKYVQIAAWVPASEAGRLLAAIAEIHSKEEA